MTEHTATRPETRESSVTDRTHAAPGSRLHTEPGSPDTITTNRPHRLTKDGVMYDDERVTAAPDMNRPLLDESGMRIDETTARPVERSRGIPSSRSHEMSSLIGRTIRLELKRRHEVRSVAFLSNKGGVGKTHISTNMSFYLARSGKQALLIDLDLGNSDVTNKLGFYCDNTIMDLLNGKRTLNQLVYSTPLGFDLIGGESGNFRLANLNAAQRKRFIRALKEIGSDYDYVMYDLSAGIQQTTIDFALAQDYQVVVTTPQDIVAGYSCLKAMFYRFQQLERGMKERDPHYKMQTTLRPFIVLNQVPDFDTAKDLFEKMSTVAKANIRGDKEFTMNLHFLGVITKDADRIRESELEHFLYSSRYGASRTGQCFNFLVKNMIQYRDPNEFTFTHRLKRFVDIFMRSVEETKYAE